MQLLLSKSKRRVLNIRNLSHFTSSPPTPINLSLPRGLYAEVKKVCLFTQEPSITCFSLQSFSGFLGGALNFYYFIYVEEKKSLLNQTWPILLHWTAVKALHWKAKIIEKTCFSLTQCNKTNFTSTVRVGESLKLTDDKLMGQILCSLSGKLANKIRNGFVRVDHLHDSIWYFNHFESALYMCFIFC